MSDEVEAWKEAAIAWEVCRSIHAKYAKGKDAVFKTRQQDYIKHAEQARSKYMEALERKHKEQS